MSSALETIGLWLAEVLRGELARLGGLCLRYLSWLLGLDRQLFDVLFDPLVIWLVLLSLLTVRVLVTRPARLRTRRPIGGAR
ncbi:MAG: hypothetical protein ABSC36_05890 [Gaiellaceae bacterium]